MNKQNMKKPKDRSCIQNVPIPPSRRGLARIHIILILLCLVLLGFALLPSYRQYRYHGEWVACAESLRTVNGALVITMIGKGQTEKLNDTATELLSILPGREGYCPSGGTVYFLKQDSGEWKAVCGMHDSDHSRRARLNASFVLKRVREEVLRAREGKRKLPMEITVTLNGEPLVCRLVTRETGIRRGTTTTDGVEGTVAFYGVKDDEMFPNASGVTGEVCYFCFADEEYCANWRAGDGWTGSAYGDRY